MKIQISSDNYLEKLRAHTQNAIQELTIWTATTLTSVMAPQLIYLQKYQEKNLLLMEIYGDSFEWGGVDYVKFSNADIPDSSELTFNNTLIGMWWGQDKVYGYKYTESGYVSLYICYSNDPCTLAWTKRWHSENNSVYRYSINNELPFVDY